MNQESLSDMWKRYWHAQINLAHILNNSSTRGAAISQMNYVCYLAQEWAGARK